jgi:hypothetical protein
MFHRQLLLCFWQRGYLQAAFAISPAATPFENDASFTVTLSNTNPNKIVIDGELVTSISGQEVLMKKTPRRTEP